MKREKDRSMLYAVLAGAILFALAFVIYDSSLAWYDRTDFKQYFSFPEGTSYQKTDSHSGFLGDGVTVLIAQVPPESSQAFIQVLWEKGFTDEPIPEKLRKKIAGDPETRLVSEVSGLWWLRDESPDGTYEYTNYTFHIYDLDTCTYYYIEYDS
jgi:hypothetical protein